MHLPFVSAGSHPVPGKANRVNVLVIDDDTVASSFLAMQLKMLGQVPHLASGGRAGLDLLAQASMALILLDCQMPEMDGFETAVAIRQAGFQGPVIGLTAETTADIRDRCLQAGMNEYERKPIDVARLKGLLDRHLQATSPARDPLAKCRMVAEKSGFAGLAKRMAESFIKSSEEMLATQNWAALHESAVKFGAEDFAEEVARVQANSDPSPLGAAWQKCKERLLEA